VRGLCGLAKCLADGHHCANIMLAAGFLAGGSRQEKASVPLPVFVGQSIAHNVPGLGVSCGLR
jgi:hypothetical protein